MVFGSSSRVFEYNIRLCFPAHRKREHMARTKQIARKSEGAVNAYKPRNAYAMRMFQFIQKSTPEKIRKPKVKKDKKVKMDKEGEKGAVENETDVNLPERCKSVEECKCFYGCFSPPSSPWESEEEDSDEEDSEEDSGSECEEGEDCKAGEEKDKE